jgi:hypothetical protein
MAGEKAWEKLWTGETQAAFDDIFKEKSMDNSWNAVGTAVPDEPVMVVEKQPSTVERLIDMQKAFNDHLLEDNKRLKSEIAELQAAMRQS